MGDVHSEILFADFSAAFSKKTPWCLLGGFSLAHALSLGSEPQAGLHLF